MDQMFINWALGILTTLIVFLLGSVRQSIKELQRTDLDIMKDFSEVKILIVGDYVKRSEFFEMAKTLREEFVGLSEALFKKLDRIETKLDGKVDK